MKNEDYTISPVETPVKKKQRIQVRRMQRVKNREKNKHLCLSIPPKLPINIDMNLPTPVE
jgi:hypothetical protein